MARVITLTVMDGTKLYVSPESISWVGTGFDSTLTIVRTVDGTSHFVRDDAEQVVNAWKD